jgi:chromatin structure-remodeling complex subunit RSC1/2
MPLPDALQTALYEVIQTVHDYQTASGQGYSRFLSAIFRDLPSRLDYPDYYQIIKEPRCLSDIQVRLPFSSIRGGRGAEAVRTRAEGKSNNNADLHLSHTQESLRRGAYSSPQAVAYDLFLIWNNAREYNEQGSLVYTDADKLEVRPLLTQEHPHATH